MADQQTTEDAAFEAACRDAFGAAIKLARECRALAYSDPGAAADRLGREGAAIMARAGMTRDEGLHYLTRIGEMVFTQEGQA